SSSAGRASGVWVRAHPRTSSRLSRSAQTSSRTHRRTNREGKGRIMAMSELNSTDSARGHDQTSTYQAGEPSGSNMIEVTELVKVYRKGAQDLRVLDGLSLNIRQGAFDAL